MPPAAHLSAGAAAAKRERCSAEVRRKAILEAAADVFLERGYAGASVDAVVERAGGSKATVYQLFGSKEGLLAALIAEGAEELAASAAALPPDAPLEDSLRVFGERFLRLIMAPRRLALYRLVVGESGRFPELGDIFYRTGPEAMVHHLADFFRAAAVRGAIETADPDELARYFIGALRGDLHFRVLFNPTRAPTARELAQHLDFVIARFLAENRAGTAA